MEATIHVFTFREGLLGKLGHDLRFTLSRFNIKARGNEISASFEPASLHVDGAVIDGRLELGKLTAADKQKIQHSLCSDVLRTREHGEVRLVARITTRTAPYRIQGTLTLCGVAQTINVVLEEKGERLRGNIELSPSQWGVKPFRALGGALRVQDRVLVSIDASADWLHAGGELNPAVELSWAPRERMSIYPPRDRQSSRNLAPVLTDRPSRPGRA
jgi:hypothetical protein